MCIVGMCHLVLLSPHLADYQKAAPSLGRPSTGVLTISEHVSTTHQSHKGVYLVGETFKTSDRLESAHSYGRRVAAALVFICWRQHRIYFLRPVGNVFLEMKLDTQ